MKVKDILRAKGDSANKCATVQPDATVDTVTRRLKLEGCGALVVSGDGSQVDGIVSERDVVRGLPVHGAALLSLPVSEIMTPEVRTCTSEDNVTEIMSEMTRHRFRHLPVVDDGKLNGIISIGDVVKNRLDELETETHVLRDYIVGRT